MSFGGCDAEGDSSWSRESSREGKCLLKSIVEE